MIIFSFLLLLQGFLSTEGEGSSSNFLYDLIQNDIKDGPSPPAQTYSEKIISEGYKFEEHKAVTEDGYILTLWRIPGRFNSTTTVTRKKPIFFLHGLLDDSYTWIVLNLNSSLPTMLSDEGFDVWLGNCRGNIFSSEHVNRTDFDSYQFYSKYWNFSLHEIAKYDIPAMINYISDRTGFEKVIYIGHSQGTTTFYLNFMLNPSYLLERIEKFVAVGNAFTVFNTHSKFIRFFEATYFFDILDKLQLKNVFNMGAVVNRLLHSLCKQYIFICKQVINSIIETKTTNHMDYNQISNLFFYEPGGTSVKNLMHWIQFIREGKLRQFNYGKDLNMKYYNSSEPPEYNIPAMKEFVFPSLIIAGDSDAFTEKEDFDYFKSVVNLQNKSFKFLKNYNHLDYLWGKDAYTDIYLDVVRFVKEEKS